MKKKIESRLAPKLDPSKLNEVKTVLHIVTDPDALVVHKFNTSITQSKFSCLKAGAWLNDEVVNFTIMMLRER